MGSRLIMFTKEGGELSSVYTVYIRSHVHVHSAHTIDLEIFAFSFLV